MNTYDIGDLVRLSVTFTDSKGTATDPTVITVRYRDPAGLETELNYGEDAALVRDDTGDYYTDLIVDRAGQWQYRFAATGTVTAAVEGQFTVRRSSF